MIRSGFPFDFLFYSVHLRFISLFSCLGIRSVSLVHRRRVLNGVIAHKSPNFFKKQINQTGRMLSTAVPFGPSHFTQCRSVVSQEKDKMAFIHFSRPWRFFWGAAGPVSIPQTQMASLRSSTCHRFHPPGTSRFIFIFIFQAIYLLKSKSRRFSDWP